jgi:Flp pilus assembly protein TadD
MKPLNWPDNHRFLAVQGWIELGALEEAAAELASISSEAQETEAVMHLSWDLLARGQRWPEALVVAQRMLQAFPQHPPAWIHFSFVLHELKRTAEARDHLLKALERFPENPTMRYNVACYETQLGNLESARHWLKAAFALPGSEELKEAARTDPDLAPLWNEGFPSI